MNDVRELFSRDAEQALLGALMLDNEVFDFVGDRVAIDDFYVGGHRALYAQIAQLLGAGKSADAVTVAEEMQVAGRLEDVGGLTYIVSLVQNVPTTKNAQHYAQIVRERSMERQLMGAAADISELASGTGPVSERMDAAQSKILQITETSASAAPKQIKPYLAEFVGELERRQAGEEITGMTTTLKVLDELLFGLHDGQLVIIGARPSHGKTSLAMQIAEVTALRGDPSAVFSMEMQGKELAEKAVSNVGRVSLSVLRSGRSMCSEDWDRVSSAMGRLNDAPLIIDQTPALSIQQVRARARSIKRRHGLKLVVVDYLQLMTGEGENRTQSIGDISRGLKAMAKELAIPVIALSQLNRKVEERPNKRPMMSDLREGGDIEQDADVILFLYRDEVYNPNSDEKGLCRIICAKQRMGPIGDVGCTFLGEFGAFGNTDWKPREDQSPTKKSRPAQEVRDVF